MGVLDESENHTPLSLTQGSSVHHQSTPNHAGLADLTAGAPFHEENDTDNELPFLSVLNTVIDHCMMEPTPMEPSEFETRQKVLVLRVFGPKESGNTEEDSSLRVAVRKGNSNAMEQLELKALMQNRSLGMPVRETRS